MNRELNHKTNILIVDDEEVVRMAHGRVLAGMDCAVEAAMSGAEALRALEARAFDVVLLDLRMPGMSGLEVLEEIKRRWPECQVVVVTGYASVDTAKEAVRRGAYDFLAKPADPQEIINVAHRAVRQKRWTLQPEARVN